MKTVNQLKKQLVSFKTKIKKAQTAKIKLKDKRVGLIKKQKTKKTAASTKQLNAIKKKYEIASFYNV